MGIQFNLIVARCKNKGIGYKGDLPWSLRKEMQYFGKMTKEVKNHEKINAVVMGRRTWDSLPDKWKPLPDRLNFVLSTQPLKLTGAVVCSSFDDLVERINSPEHANKIETAWIIGGSKIYEDAIKLNLCYRLYLTEILQEFECDVFFNTDVNKGFKEVSDDRVPKGVQEENDINALFAVFRGPAIPNEALKHVENDGVRVKSTEIQFLGLTVSSPVVLSDITKWLKTVLEDCSDEQERNLHF